MNDDEAVGRQHRFFLKLGEILARQGEAEEILGAAAWSLHYDLAYPIVLIRVSRGPWLDTKASAGLDQEVVERLRGEPKMVEGGGLAGRAVRMGEAQYAADLPQEAPADLDPLLPEVHSQIAAPMVVGGVVLGVLVVSAAEVGAFWPGDVAFLEAVAGQLGVTVQSARQGGGRAAEKIDATQVSVTALTAVARALEWHSPFFAGHSERVSWIAGQLGAAVGIEGREAENLETAALVHDLGMMGIPDTILSRKGKLSAEETAIVRLHPVAGERMCRLLPNGDEVAPIVAAHHELLDGTGYPQGLHGDEIPKVARVITVADVYDALTSDRPYRAAFAFTEALERMEEDSGTKFDEEVLEALDERAPALEKALAERSRFMPGKPDDEEE